MEWNEMKENLYAIMYIRVYCIFIVVGAAQILRLYFIYIYKQYNNKKNDNKNVCILYMFIHKYIFKTRVEIIFRRHEKQTQNANDYYTYVCCIVSFIVYIHYTDCI